MKRLIFILGILLLGSNVAFAASATSVPPGTVAPSATCDKGTGYCAAVDSSGNLQTGGTVTATITFPAQGSDTAGETGPLNQGAVTTGAPTYTTGKTNPLSLDTSGNLRTTVPSVGTISSAAPTRANLSGLSDGTNLQQWLTALALGDGVNGNNTGAVATWLWNGTTFDRQPGTTKGAYSILRDAAGNARGANVNASNQLSVSVDNALTQLPAALDGSGFLKTHEQGTATVSGTVTVQQSTAANLKVDLSGTGANATAVKVDGSAVTQPVSGTFWQATQPVSGTFWQATQPVSGTFWQATQPISGTTTSNQGTANATPWNENISQINGITPLMGNGTTGTGSPRVTVASDNTPFAVKIDQTTPGTTNKVSIGTDGTVAVNTALPAGSNTIGNVGVASGGIASGAIASGAVASGAFASGSIGSGAIASGAVASGAVSSGAFAAGSISDGADVTLGAKADAASTATDTTPVTIMSVLKEISAKEQAPASRAVTNAGTFATQSAITAASGSIASGAIASGAVASGAVASGAFASGAISDGADVTLGAKADAANTATDTTPVSVVSILKEISAKEQAPVSRAVTNAGTFAVQEADGANTTLGAKADAKSTATDTTAITAMQVLKEISYMAQNPAAGAAGTNLLGKVVTFPGTLTSGAVTSAMTGTTSTSLVAAVASNNLYITSCQFSNDHASVSTNMLLQDGSGGTTLWKGLVPFGGGSNVTFPTPLKVPTQGNGLYVANVTTGSSTYANCQGWYSTVSY